MPRKKESVSDLRALHVWLNAIASMDKDKPIKFERPKKHCAKDVAARKEKIITVFTAMIKMFLCIEHYKHVLQNNACHSVDCPVCKEMKDRITQQFDYQLGLYLGDEAEDCDSIMETYYGKFLSEIETSLV